MGADASPVSTHPASTAEASEPPRVMLIMAAGEDEAARDEAARLAAVADYALLDAPADAEVDAVTRLATLIAGVPSASVHLITGDRQCQLSGVNFSGGNAARADSMCGVRLLEKRFVLVPDARLDPLYADGPFVTGELGAVRFYASAPLLIESGEVLGTLCVFDTRPATLTPAQVAGLQDLAQVLVALFERRRQTRLAQQHALEAAKQRTLAEVMTAEAEARYELNQAVLDAVDVGIVIAGPDGHLSEFNPTARAWHGLDADTSLDPAQHTGVYDLFAADGRTPLAASEVPLRRALQHGRVQDAEIVIAPTGRAPLTVRCSGRTMTRSDGTPLGAVVAMSDVTSLRAGEAALQQAMKELERSNAELAQFAGIASHDLNSPLTVVDGYLEMLQDVYGEGLDEEGRAWIGAARRGTGRMKDLISALLAYAQAGSGDCRREKVHLQDVVDQAVLDSRAAIREAGARIEVRSLPTVSGDEVLLRQLLQNLIGNAVKYRHPDRPCRIEISAAREERGWVLAVRDNGIGIPPTQREAVFAMFTQLDPSARSGHGIGLATCQRIVERHGGRIWATATTVATADGGEVTDKVTDEVTHDIANEVTRGVLHGVSNTAGSSASGADRTHPRETVPGYKMREEGTTMHFSVPTPRRPSAIH